MKKVKSILAACALVLATVLVFPSDAEASGSCVWDADEGCTTGNQGTCSGCTTPNMQ